MISREILVNYHDQGYKTISMPENHEKPKALMREAWQNLPNEENIKTSMYAVIQDKNKIVLYFPKNASDNIAPIIGV